MPISYKDLSNSEVDCHMLYYEIEPYFDHLMDIRYCLDMSELSYWFEDDKLVAGFIMEDGSKDDICSFPGFKKLTNIDVISDNGREAYYQILEYLYEIYEYVRRMYDRVCKLVDTKQHNDETYRKIFAERMTRQEYENFMDGLGGAYEDLMGLIDDIIDPSYHATVIGMRRTDRKVTDEYGNTCRVYEVYLQNGTFYKELHSGEDEYINKVWGELSKTWIVRFYEYDEYTPGDRIMF